MFPIGSGCQAIISVGQPRYSMTWPLARSITFIAQYSIVNHQVPVLILPPDMISLAIKEYLNAHGM